MVIISKHSSDELTSLSPIKMEFLESTDEIIEKTEQVLLEKGIVKPGDVVVVLLGAPVYVRGTTNLMKLHVISDS